MSDREIEKAIRAGEHNKKVRELIHNWCQHASVKKFGGTGMVEAATGLPIGHHFMACDHASAAGMAAFDLAETALDFHDRNCVDCSKRIPVRFPNLATLVADRDLRVAENKKRQEQAARERKDAFDRRCVERDGLRAKVKSESRTVLDQLQELDQGHSEAKEALLIQTARLAPEIFSPELIELLFSYLEHGEWWSMNAGLSILSQLKSDLPRLTRCAAKLLSESFSIKISTAILLENQNLIEKEAVAPLISIASSLAAPRYSIGGSTQIADPSLFIALQTRFPDEVARCINGLLNARSSSKICVGASAALTSARIDPTIIASCLKNAVAILARMDHLVAFDGYNDREDASEITRDLGQLLSLALKHDPVIADSIVESYFPTAKSEAQERLLSPYRLLFVENRFEEEDVVEELPGHEIAIKRLVGASIQDTNYSVISAAVETFRSAPPSALFPLIRKQTAYLLGSVVLLEERSTDVLSRRDKETEFYRKLEHNNLYNIIRQLQGRIVIWCASAGSDQPAATTEYLQVLAGLPSTADSLRSVFIKGLAVLMDSVDGMRQAIGPLYSALVGTCQVCRAAAVKAISKISSVRRSDLPDLMFEAFLLALSDPFVIVHKAAVHALEDIAIPEKYKPEVSLRLTYLLLTYTESKSDDEFLARSIAIFASQYGSKKILQGQFGAKLVKHLARMEPHIVLERIGWFGRHFESTEGFGRLAVSLLTSTYSEHRADQVVRLLREMTPDALVALVPDLSACGNKTLEDGTVLFVCLELLSRAGAWDNAVALCKASVQAIPDSTREKPRRLQHDLVRAAASFEQAVATGNEVNQLQAAQEWRRILEEMETDRKEHESRRNPLNRFLPPNTGA